MLREGPDGAHVVVALDVLAAARHGHLVEHLEEIVVEHVGEGVGRPLLGGQLRPAGIDGLRVAENRLDVVLQAQLLRPAGGVAPVCQGELVAQVAEAVVHGSGGQHEHLGLHALLDDLLHEQLVAVHPVFRRRVAAVSEVVALVDDNQAVSAPVQAVEGQAGLRRAARAREVGVVEHVVLQAVARDGVVHDVRVVGDPVVAQLLRAQHEHVLVAALVVLDHGERGERLAQAHGIGQDTAVVGLELVDDGERRVLLEVVELVPDEAFAEAQPLVGQHVLGDVVQKLAEYAVERHVVDELWRVFLIHCRDAVDDGIGDVVELARIPGVVELLEQGARLGGVQAHGHVGGVRGVVAAELARGETVEGHIGYVVVRLVDIHEAAHAPLALEGAEARLAADPVGALGRDGLLRELVAQLDLEVGAAEALLAGKARDVELALLARWALLGERLRREDEAQLVDALELLGKFLVGVHGEHRRGYRHAIAVGYIGDKVVLDDARPVVEEVWLHGFLCPLLRELFDHARAHEGGEAHAPQGRLLFRSVAQGVGDAKGHGDLVAVHQEAPDLGLVGIALDEILVAVGHLCSHHSKCNTNAFAAL